MRTWDHACYLEEANQAIRDRDYRVFDPLNPDHCPVVADGEYVTSLEIYPRLGRRWATGAEYLYWITADILDEDDAGRSIMFRTDSRDVICEDDDVSLYGDQQPTNLYFRREPGWVIVRDRRDSNWAEEPMPWGWSVSDVMTSAEMMYEVRNIPVVQPFMPIRAATLFPAHCLTYEWGSTDPLEQLPYQELIALGFI